ncbi:MAG: chromosomal replication initiator DnaA, partial [Caulobacteraceae bacterium]
MKTQLRLDLTREPRYGADDFVVSPANQAAAALVMEDWRAWPAGLLAIVGPPGSGKTHLARMWAQAVDAAILTPPLSASPPGLMLIEDADRWTDADGLFHLLNSLQPGSALLLTARTPPSQWPTTLPDLRSRLNAMTTTEIEAPDDV